MTRLRIGESLGSQFDWYSEDFGDRLSFVIEKIGTRKTAAALVGVAYDQLRRWQIGKQKMPFSAAAILCREAGVSLDWLAYGGGAGNAQMESPSVPMPLFRVDRIRDVSELKEDYWELFDEEYRSDVFVRMISIDMKWVMETLEIDSPKTVALLRAEGAGMAPTIEAGDVMVVDVSIQDFDSDGLYVLFIGGRLSPVRVQHRLGGKIRIGYDNPTYADEEIENGDKEKAGISGRIRQVYKNY